MVESINALTPLDEARGIIAKHYDLTYTRAVAKVTARVYDRVKASVSESDWTTLAPLIVHINRLKAEKRALLLVHHYQNPAIYSGVADVVGDTMELAQAASRSRRRLIVQCGAAFMGEITKLLSPKKRVLLPDSRATCSVAGSITVDDVLAIRSQYAGTPIIASINSTAAVKSASDICCTATNALKVVESLPGDRVVLVPDQYLARNIAKRTAKKVITWAGTCEALDAVTSERVADLRAANPDARVLAHLGCSPNVVAAADFAGSTSEMIAWIRAEKPGQVVMLAEQNAVDNAAAEVPQTRFVRGAGVCTQMRRITLENVLWSLHSATEVVEIANDIAVPARKALQQMLSVGRKVN